MYRKYVSYNYTSVLSNTSVKGTEMTIVTLQSIIHGLKYTISISKFISEMHRVTLI